MRSEKWDDINIR